MKILTSVFLAIAFVLSSIPARASITDKPVDTASKYSLPVSTSFATQTTVATPAAGATWSASWYYGLKSKATAAVAEVTFDHLTNLFGHANWSLDVSAFAGTTIKNQAPIGGFTVGKSWNLASQLTVTAGVSVAIAAGLPVDFGPTVGLAWKF